VWSRDAADSALWLHRLAVRHARKASARRPRAASEPPAPGVDVLAAVPGISTRTARVLLDRFGSIAGLLEAGPGPLGRGRRHRRRSRTRARRCAASRRCTRPTAAHA
jgi:ERCC4-type nuclease